MKAQAGRRAGRGIGTICSTMGWEKRGAHSYYYRKEREGSRVKSVYVGRGEIAQMISQIQETSPMLEKLARATRLPEQVKREKVDAALEKATDLIQLLTQATLLAAGFHTHHRQWRRTRNADCG
ncbi:MAG: hypothetical protein H0U18_03985 [Pyrinomonadaceae bacterium]|nr:hypothetical protein [Pyrinomonadaceae bacterium]